VFKGWESEEESARPCWTSPTVSVSAAGIQKGVSKRRMPIPANITFAGENTYGINVRAELNREGIVVFTNPTP
jgi:hypothetical protein